MVDEVQARDIAKNLMTESADARGLDESFVQVWNFLKDNNDKLSWRGRNKPDLNSETGVRALAVKFIGGYNRSDFPAIPGTVPDEMVSVVMQYAYGYSQYQTEQIKLEHQHAMCAENCVGSLLERYLDSILRIYGWHWCCGDFVKAIDFIAKDNDGKWLALQIKNRDNSENSSSSYIRHGTEIQKWFRSFSRSGGTNWDNLPPLMQGYGLSEDGFSSFVQNYLELNKPQLNSFSLTI